MKTSVLLEIILEEGTDMETLLDMVSSWAVDGFKVDKKYKPVLMGDESSAAAGTVILHGWAENRAALELLKVQPLVFAVWKDTVVEPMLSSYE